MINLAGRDPETVDATCTSELMLANIPLMEDRPEILRSKGEVPSNVVGILGGWTFERAWYYWIARWEPPAAVTLTMKQAIRLHQKHGADIRVDGHCGCPEPNEWWPENGTPNLYHIDTQEGLIAFAKTIGLEY
jgi:hypothetical protein